MIDELTRKEAETLLDRFVIALRAVVTLGVPSVIAMFLVYQMSVVLSGRLSTIETDGKLHATEMREKLDQTLQGMRSIDDNNVRTQTILRAICVNLSKTPEQQTSCFAASSPLTR